MDKIKILRLFVQKTIKWKKNNSAFFYFTAGIRILKSTNFLILTVKKWTNNTYIMPVIQYRNWAEKIHDFLNKIMSRVGVLGKRQKKKKQKKIDFSPIFYWNVTIDKTGHSRNADLLFCSRSPPKKKTIMPL